MNQFFLFISGPEIIIIILVIVMLFGAKKIPELAKGLGQGINEFKKATDDIKNEIKSESEVFETIKDFKKNVEKGADSIKKTGLKK